MNFKNLILKSEDLNALSFCSIKKNNILIYKDKKNQTIFYLISPNFISILKSSLVLKFQYPANKSVEFKQFFSLFLKFLKLSNQNFVKILVLRGLGFRINITDKFLQFKLGFSHLINMALPTNKISALIKKKSLYLTSPNLVFLGNFAEKIKNFKKPNNYTGKGFHFKDKQFYTKVFKKK
jgi:large subunit ribosomal protein L6